MKSPELIKGEFVCVCCISNILESVENNVNVRAFRRKMGRKTPFFNQFPPWPETVFLLYRFRKTTLIPHSPLSIPNSSVQPLNTILFVDNFELRQASYMFAYERHRTIAIRLCINTPVL